MAEAIGTILLAEDDLTLRDMYQIRLEAEGYRILLASNGEEALKILETETPDICLLDIMMPKVNGLDVLEKMKKNPVTKAIPVIILTVLIQDQTRVKGLMSGADDYLIKSETMPGEVIKKVADTIAKSKVSKQ
jgi:two-component system phosphate regulon response regulator PhoB